MPYVVGEENVGNIVVKDIIPYVLGKVAAVNHMYLFKRIKEISWQRISEAVFKDK